MRRRRQQRVLSRPNRPLNRTTKDSHSALTTCESPSRRLNDTVEKVGHRTRDLRLGRHRSRKQPNMRALGKSTVLLRLCMVTVLMSYMFAGSSFALPTESRCARCTKLGNGTTMAPGTSCPLSLHGHDCHGTQGKIAGHIKLCPDGCLHHDGEGGEIPSLAKFLSAPPLSLLDWLSAGPVLTEILLFSPEPSLVPLQHPPSSSL